MRSKLIAQYALFVLVCPLLLSAQSYRCDWQVVAGGGAEMGSSYYRCGATACQAAAGYMNSPVYQAFIGFWQTDAQVGIQEEPAWSEGTALVTRLYAPVPNPSRGMAVIRYTVGVERLVQVQIYDLAGREVRVLVNASQKPGRYSLRWDGRDDRGSLLGSGVYLCRLRSGDYVSSEKLLLMR